MKKFLVLHLAELGLSCFLEIVIVVDQPDFIHNLVSLKGIGSKLLNANQILLDSIIYFFKIFYSKISRYLNFPTLYTTTLVLVVSMLAFYTGDPSLNPAEV